MSRSNPSPTTVTAVLAKPKPVDTRMAIPCTSLPAEIARLDREGVVVLAIERQRNRRNTATHYLLTTALKGNVRNFASRHGGQPVKPVLAGQSLAGAVGNNL